jgi:hypothetical protein
MAQGKHAQRDKAAGRDDAAGGDDSMRFGFQEDPPVSATQAKPWDVLWHRESGRKFWLKGSRKARYSEVLEMVPRFEECEPYKDEDGEIVRRVFKGTDLVVPQSIPPMKEMVIIGRVVTRKTARP